MTTLPPEFGLRGFPGKRFRVYVRGCYDDQLVLEVRGYGIGDDNGVWRQFGRFPAAEVAKEMTK
jgi:hypothetical protein